MNPFKKFGFNMNVRIRGLVNMIGVRKHEPILPRMVSGGADPSDVIETLRAVKGFDDWVPTWSALAERYVNQARESIKHGHLVTAGKFLTMAAMYYRFAEFLAINEEDRRLLFKKLVPLYEEAGKYFSPPHQVIEIEFEDYTIRGYLRHPDKAEKVPCLFSIGGVDGIKEEKSGPSNDAIQRGWAMLAFDIPGQGALRRLNGKAFQPDFHKVVSKFIDRMEEIPAIDAKRIALVGGSAGGFFALKSAAMDSRVRAVVDLSGPFEMKTLYNAPFPIPKTMEYGFGCDTKKGMLEILKDYTLEDCIDKIKAPVLVVHGRKDKAVPFPDAQKIYDRLNTEKEMLYYEDGDHVCFNHFGEAIPRMLNWLEKQFKKNKQ
jgi:2,6-dihydroxypseudooxynicotine hydrolase